MRSLFSFGASKEMSSLPAFAGRPEILRRKTVGANARGIVLASAICLPFTLLALAHGQSIPFMLALIGLVAGVISMAMHDRADFENAAAAQVYGLILIGAIPSVIDPAVIDFGLATALLAPVLASLLAYAPLRRRAWLLVVLVALLSAASSLHFISVPVRANVGIGAGGAFAFAIVAIIVADTASRLNTAFQGHDNAQINAYRHLIEHMQDGAMRFSKSGEVLFTSRSVEKLFGCKRYELSGNGLSERIHVLDRPAYLTAFDDANHGGRGRSIELRMRYDDDVPGAAPRFIWIEASLSPVIDEDEAHAPYEVVALFRDITERKDHEIEMREARRTAEDASEAKSRFLAIIGHELRTPLNAIVGFSEMMTSGIGGQLSPSHQDYAGMIHQSGHHLLDVVKMLLDMSKIEAGKFELQTDTFAPNALIEPSLQIVEPMARARHLKIDVQMAANLPNLVADERACRQILINLLSNAIKFSHDGGDVTVAMKRQGANLNISVRDHGIGMSPESVMRLGEPFFQAQDGLSRRYEGTGLGISIVKGLVELHGGRLHAASEVGNGTTMTVLLPINGPAINLEETGSVTPLRQKSERQQTSSWQDARRKAL